MRTVITPSDSIRIIPKSTFSRTFESYLPVLATCAYTLFRLSTVGATLSLALEAPLVFNGFKKTCEFVGAFRAAINEQGHQITENNLYLRGAVISSLPALLYMGVKFLIAGGSINLLLETTLVYNLYRDAIKLEWDSPPLNPIQKGCAIALMCTSFIGLVAFNTGALNVNAESLSNAVSPIMSATREIVGNSRDILEASLHTGAAALTSAANFIGR